MLCADGGAGGADVPRPSSPTTTSDAYVAKVLSLAAELRADVGPSGRRGRRRRNRGGGPDAGQVAVAWALAQVGTPYVWGGETPGVGFDCSGLTQAAYKVAGVALPRVAQDQFDAGPRVGRRAPCSSRVTWSSSAAGPDSVSHVGLYVGVLNGRTMMVDAPHTGADVRVEAFPPTIGARGAASMFVGATRPGVEAGPCPGLHFGAEGE